MALTKVTNSLISGAVVNVFDFMTAEMIADVQARTALIDTTAAIQAAINSLSAIGGTSGVVRMPKGRYLTTAKITLPACVSLIGDGQFGGNGVYDQGATTILGRHNGTAILSLVGSASCMVSDLCLMSDGPGNPWPQTGLLLGRTGIPSCGYHHIIRVAVYGNFTAANVFSIASEDNYFEDFNVWNYGLGGAKYCYYSSIGNSSFTGVTEPLYTSSNLNNIFNKFFYVNANPNPDAACIFIDNAEGMGNFSFFGGYCTPAGGSYVTIRNGFIDGKSAIGTYTFAGFAGERLAGGDPLYGFDLLASLAVELRGLCITNCRLDFLAGANHYQIRQSQNLTLVAPNIVMQPPEAFVYALSDIYRKKIRGGIVSVGRDFLWTNVTFATDWVNSFGAPYAPAGYNVDPTGILRLRGTVQRQTAGDPVIFTLPAKFRPAYNMYFSTRAGTSSGRILVEAATGNVSLVAGTVTDEIDLSPVQFDFIEQ